MTTVASLITDLQISTARTDSAAQAMMLRGINAGVVAATMLFRPPEQRTSEALTATVALNYVSMSTLTNLLFIEEVYNTTSALRVWPLEFSELEVLPLPVTLGAIMYYAIHGSILHYRPKPLVETTLTAYYLKSPTRLTSGDSLPFSQNDDFIYSFAQTFVWAAFEEPDSASLWQKVVDATGVPQTYITQIRDALTRQVPSGSNIQAAVSKSSSKT